MNEAAPRRSLLRQPGSHAAVSNLELFFDLVYVFAITQLSHSLVEHLSVMGVIEALVLFLAVWWAWMYTTWAANWADPERIPIRILLLALMLASLVISIALPKAFGAGGPIFAFGYVLVQLGRTLAMAWIFHREPGRDGRNMARIAIWFAASGVLWCVGAFADSHTRLAWWGAALAIEYAGPLVFFWLPVLGRSSAADWDIAPGHMAERCALFIIIALGEGIVVTGSHFNLDHASVGQAAALGLAFLGSALMWWLYFDLGAERGADHFEHHDQPGRIARNAYTYLHMPIVAGIVVTAVGDALLLEHWHEPASRALVLTTCGGLLLYLAGLGEFKRFSSAIGNVPLSHQAALALLLLLGSAAQVWPMPALVFVAGTVAILALAAVWEWGSFHGGWRERVDRWRGATS